MKSRVRDWLKVAVLLLDEAAVVVLVLLILRALKVELALPVAVIGALLLGAAVFIIHKAVIPSFHRKQVTGAEGLVGLAGKVVEPLALVGIIRVCDEYWKAKSVDGDIEAGEEVEILGLEGLTLIVRHKHLDG